jgi:hypothetical protein
VIQESYWWIYATSHTAKRETPMTAARVRNPATADSGRSATDFIVDRP